MISNKTKQFIKKHLDLIDAGNYETLYELSRELDGIQPEEVCEMTLALLDTDINPLEHMDVVPGHYLYHCDKLDIVKIPENIKWLHPFSFEESSVTEVYIPDNTTVANYVFSYCPRLTKVYLGGPNIELFSNSFYASMKIKLITFNGTVEEYARNYTTTFGTIEKVVCNNAIMEYGKVTKRF